MPLLLILAKDMATLKFRICFWSLNHSGIFIYVYTGYLQQSLDGSQQDYIDDERFASELGPAYVS